MTWTHNICESCWKKREDERTPTTLKTPPDDTCCFCGKAGASGIYVRHDPKLLDCLHREQK